MTLLLHEQTRKNRAIHRTRLGRTLPVDHRRVASSRRTTSRRSVCYRVKRSERYERVQRTHLALLRQHRFSYGASRRSIGVSTARERQRCQFSPQPIRIVSSLNGIEPQTIATRPQIYRRSIFPALDGTGRLPRMTSGRTTAKQIWKLTSIDSNEALCMACELVCRAAQHLRAFTAKEVL